MTTDAGQWQTRSIEHPTVSVHQDADSAVLMFDLPPRARGATLGSVFVRLSVSEVADLREKLYLLWLRP